VFISGHKPPAIADNAPGRYAGALFSSASKKEALDVVLRDLTHLAKVINEESMIK
jgi:F-type H+-transporting ATPase subunit O